jgi:hypothetical protein
MIFPHGTYWAKADLNLIMVADARPMRACCCSICRHARGAVRARVGPAPPPRSGRALRNATALSGHNIISAHYKYLRNDDFVGNIVKCPNCGFENIDDSAFCGSCGTALTSSSPVLPVQNDQPSPKNHTGRKVVAVAIVAIVVLAALAIGLSLGNGNSAGVQKQVVRNNDFLTFGLSGSVNGIAVSGSVTDTFSNMTNNTLTLTSVSNSTYFAGSSTSYSYNTSEGVWTSPGLTGMVLSNPSLKIGSESMSTIFGTKQVDHYRMTISSEVFDYYVAQGSGIPFKMILTVGANNEVMTLVSTNMDWIKSL